MPTVEYRKTVLDNGVTLVAERHPHVRALSIGVWVRVGSAHESPSISGASHFVEHMVFKGTEKRTPLEIATVLESLGGDLNAFTDKEITCYHATVLNEHIDVALDVLSDLVIHPTFPKDELERERKVVLQEMSMVEDSPEEWIGDLFFETIWKKDSLGRPVIGNRKSLENFSRARLVTFFETYYRPENMVVSVAGNVDLDELREKCERFFVFEKREPVSRKALPTPQYFGGRRARAANADQLHLLMGFEAVSFKDPRRFDALVTSLFLGGGMSSRLFQEIREKAGLAYSVDCDMTTYTGTGVITISAAMAPRSLMKCLGIISREIQKLRHEEIAASALQLVKGQLKGMILLSSDQMETRQESLGRNEIVFGRYISVDEVIEEIERVSTRRMHELAQSLFVPEKEAVVVLTKSKPPAHRLTIFE